MSKIQHDFTLKKPVENSELSLPAEILARKLLGFYLTNISSEGITVGKIVEVEAYTGANDPAAHSYRGQTEQTKAMFGPPGHAYIYLSYGVHYCLNVTAGKVGYGEGVLIRALEPVEGLGLMWCRRNRASNYLPVSSNQSLPVVKRVLLTNGPGKLVQAMGVSKELYGHNLTQPPLFLSWGEVNDDQVCTGPRIGISQAKDKQLRFWVKNNPFVSKSRSSTISTE